MKGQKSRCPDHIDCFLPFPSHSSSCRRSHSHPARLLISYVKHLKPGTNCNQACGLLLEPVISRRFSTRDGHWRKFSHHYTSPYRGCKPCQTSRAVRLDAEFVISLLPPL